MIILEFIWFCIGMFLIGLVVAMCLNPFPKRLNAEEKRKTPEKDSECLKFLTCLFEKYPDVRGEKEEDLIVRYTFPEKIAVQIFLYEHKRELYVFSAELDDFLYYFRSVREGEATESCDYLEHEQNARAISVTGKGKAEIKEEDIEKKRNEIIKEIILDGTRKELE